MKQTIVNFLKIKNRSRLKAAAFGDVLLNGAAGALTIQSYFIFALTFLFLRQLCPDVSGEVLFNDGWGITIRLVFDCFAVIVLARYLTPARAYRYFQRMFAELSNPCRQAGNAVAVLVLVFTLVSSLASMTAMIKGDRYDLRPTTAPSGTNGGPFTLPESETPARCQDFNSSPAT